MTKNVRIESSWKVNKLKCYTSGYEGHDIVNPIIQLIISTMQIHMQKSTITYTVGLCYSQSFA